MILVPPLSCVKTPARMRPSSKIKLIVAGAAVSVLSNTKREPRGTATPLIPLASQLRPKSACSAVVPESSCINPTGPRLKRVRGLRSARTLPVESTASTLPTSRLVKCTLRTMLHLKTCTMRIVERVWHRACRCAMSARTVARECDTRCRVIAQRIEQVEPQEADVLSARALTDLSGLLGFAERHLKTGGTALFPKGEAWKKEVDDARKQWKFDVVPFTSLTEPQAVVLKLKGIARV